jgi:O-acetyl-ADP-ribose deacetylase (regulator of RNase III)
MSIEVRKKTFGSDLVLLLVSGDITEEKVEAIVNAANSQLLHGGGVAGAIVRKGGKSIQDESLNLAPVKVGEAVVTGAGSLHANYVIHTVGPRWGEGNEPEKLKSAINSVLRCAREYKIKSLSLPAVSTGIFGFPLDKAAEIILGEISTAIKTDYLPTLKEIRICLFDKTILEVFEKKWETVVNDL